MVVSCPSNFCRAPDSLVTLSQAIRTSACMPTTDDVTRLCTLRLQLAQLQVA